jgi:hypothetical protein
LVPGRARRSVRPLPVRGSRSASAYAARAGECSDGVTRESTSSAAVVPSCGRSSKASQGPAEAAVELGSEWRGLAVTHGKSLSWRQERSENSGKPEGPRKSCAELRGSSGKSGVISGRIFYTSMGHREDVWENPMYQGLLIGALRWVTGKVDASVEPNVSQVTPEYKRLSS